MRPSGRRNSALPEPQSRSAAHSVITAIGKRKTSVARVRMKLGTGQILVNGRSLEEYFPRETLQTVARQPLEAANLGTTFDAREPFGGAPQARRRAPPRHRPRAREEHGTLRPV
jgi:small subunit ribosomal protein S9